MIFEELINNGKVVGSCSEGIFPVETFLERGDHVAGRDVLVLRGQGGERDWVFFFPLDVLRSVAMNWMRSRKVEKIEKCLREEPNGFWMRWVVL